LRRDAAYIARMASKNTRDASAIGFRMVAALERYQQQWEELVDPWFDREYWMKVNAELDELRKLVAALPELSADLMEVIMRHAQLLRSLVKPSSPQVKAAEMAALRRKHGQAVDGLRSKCLRLVAPAY
jgi:hypothetical protein